MKPELVITIVAHRSISAPTVLSLEQCRQKLNIPYLVSIAFGDALISRGRSRACTTFLDKPELKYLIFIDEDINFTPEDIAKVYSHLENGYHVIGGLYAVQGATQFSSYGYNSILVPDGKIQEIEYLATGFMGISRKVLEKIRDEIPLTILNPKDWSRCYPFFEDGRCFQEKTLKNIASEYGVSGKKLLRICDRLGWRVRHGKGDDLFISEDWDFCDKVRLVGEKVFADTSIQVGHLREQMYTGKDVGNFWQNAHMSQKVYGAMNKLKGLAPKLVQDLADFLHKTPQNVVEYMQTIQRTLADKWTKHEGDTVDFYKDNADYLYDLVMFNSQDVYYGDRLGQLVNITGKKVLDIGCGIGTCAFMMAEQGNDTIGWDINQRCIEFAKLRKARYELKGEFTTEKPDFSQFDLVIAVDVLEHIENLGEFLLELGRGMKAGAKFYHSDYFPKDDLWPMHFEDNKKQLSKWLKEAGLIEWNERWAIKTQ